VKITASEEVGMRCMVQLALHPTATVSLSELAAAEGLAEPFAAKVLGQLRRAGLVVAARGRSGGYRLAEPPEAITVARILAAVGRRLFDAGFCHRRSHRGQAPCLRLSECALRPVWSHLDALLEDFFTRTTLADLATGERATRDRLAARWPLARHDSGSEGQRPTV